MNLYQHLNQSYRDFKVKENLALKESEEKENDKTLTETETTIEVPLKVEVAGTEVVNPEVTTVDEPIVEEPTEEEPVVEECDSKICKECGKEVCECDKTITEAEELKTLDDAISLVSDYIKMEGTTFFDEFNPKSFLDDMKRLLDCLSKVKEAAGTITNEGEESEEVKETEDSNEESVKEDLTECEVKSFRVTRISPATNSYMIEAETNDGIKYIVGKNYDKENMTLDEAEIFDADSKDKASNHFKSLLSSK